MTVRWERWRHTRVLLGGFKHCYSVITEVEGDDKCALFVSRVVCQHLAYKSQYMAHHSLPVIQT